MELLLLVKIAPYPGSYRSRLKRMRYKIKRSRPALKYSGTSLALYIYIAATLGEQNIGRYIGVAFN